jgi:TetR/AcrR family fatty acid metabolism transcriptional regulator
MPTTTDKRLAIMQTAEKLFSNRRIHEITLDEVAQKAQVGKGTIYRHFSDKDDLFFQVATSGFEELCRLVRDEVSRESQFEEQLLQMCVAISAFFDGRRQMFHLMQSEDARMPECKGSIQQRWLEHRKQLVDAVARVLERGVTAGRVRSDIAPAILSNLLLGLLRTRARDLRDLPEPARAHAVVIDVFLNGAAPPPMAGESAEV